ncbi:MAG: hypothetical protein IPM54_43720 [Polyangiaceae bacterium]|nr:hypothetical protein [Polyangiaceae bacterium]
MRSSKTIAHATAVFVALVCTSCGAAVKPARSPKETKIKILPEHADAEALLVTDAARAREAGAGPLEVVSSTYLSEGDRTGAFISIPDESCALVIARGSASVVDVDLFAYEDDGATFGVDESSDARPAVLICPPHPRRLFVSARVVSGGGLVGIGVQALPPAATSAVEKVAGTRGRSGGETGRLEAWPGLEAKLLAHRAWLGGAWEDVRRAALPVAPRAATRMTVPLEPDRCLDVFVSPGEEVGSLEVVAEDAAGRIVARGRDRGRDRALVLCSASSAEISIAVRPRASTGVVAVVASRSRLGAAGFIEPCARAEYVTEPRELSEARADLDKRLVDKGYGAAKLVTTAAAKLGSRTPIAVDLPAGCSRLDVIAGKPLADVGAALWDERGVLLAEGRGGAGVTLFACGAGGPARIDVEAYSRPGPYAIELRKDKLAPPLLVAHPWAASRLLAVLDAGGVRASAASAAGSVHLSLDASSRATLPIDVPAKACVEVVAALDRVGAGLDMRLADASTGENTVTRGRFVVADRRCASDVPAKAIAEFRLSAGKADALVFMRTLPD